MCKIDLIMIKVFLRNEKKNPYLLDSLGKAGCSHTLKLYLFTCPGTVPVNSGLSFMSFLCNKWLQESAVSADSVTAFVFSKHNISSWELSGCTEHTPISDCYIGGVKWYWGVSLKWLIGGTCTVNTNKLSGPLHSFCFFSVIYYWLHGVNPFLSCSTYFHVICLSMKCKGISKVHIILINNIVFYFLAYRNNIMKGLIIITVKLQFDVFFSVLVWDSSDFRVIAWPSCSCLKNWGTVSYTSLIQYLLYFLMNPTSFSAECLLKFSRSSTPANCTSRQNQIQCGSAAVVEMR